MEMEEENKEEGQTTTPAYDDPSKKRLSGQVNSLNYMDKAEDTGKQGAEKLQNVSVPRYNPITLKRMIQDPEIRKSAPSLLRNAVFKGLEGALTTKASGRDFDPNTRIGQYNDAEMQRYTENATDKENAIYQAQKQPIENAISAQAQAGIQTEDAALNSYIQDYTAEKDQNRKVAILQQLMGQAGLTKGVDEEGNPIYKEWGELETADLLKLNQLMQYLSGDTSVMNVLVGQYGPEVMQKVDDVIAWLKGEKPSDKPAEENAFAPKYSSLDEWKTAFENDDPSAIIYGTERIVDLGNGNYYDVSDTSDGALIKLADTVAYNAVYNNTKYKDVLDQIENKTKSATGGGWFNKNGKNARATVEALINKKVADYQAQKQGQFNSGSNTTGLNVSDYGVIDTELAKLLKDKNKTSTKVDTNALKQMVEGSTMTDEQKEEYLGQIEDAEAAITLNKNEADARARSEKQEKDAKNRAKDINKLVPVGKKTNYAKEGGYSQALAECKKLAQSLKETGNPLSVLKYTDAYQRINEIAQLATKGGRFEKEDTTGSLANYLSYLGDPSYWENK